MIVMSLNFSTVTRLKASAEWRSCSSNRGFDFVSLYVQYIVDDVFYSGLSTRRQRKWGECSGAEVDGRRALVSLSST